jgi:hypothetical protein
MCGRFRPEKDLQPPAAQSTIASYHGASFALVIPLLMGKK